MKSENMIWNKNNKDNQTVYEIQFPARTWDPWFFILKHLLDFSIFFFFTLTTAVLSYYRFLIKREDGMGAGLRIFTFFHILHKRDFFFNLDQILSGRRDTWEATLWKCFVSFYYGYFSKRKELALEKQICKTAGKSSKYMYIHYT